MSRRYPPGPLNFNAWIGLTWRHAFRLWHDPLEFIEAMARQYGDLVFYRFFMYEAFQLNHPDLVRDVLVTRAKCFAKQSRQMALLRSITGDGLLNSEGELWQRQRRIIAPAFAADQGRILTAAAAEETARMLDSWEQRDEVAIHDESLALLTAAVARAMFGVDIRHQAAELADAMSAISAGLLDEFANPFQLPDWFPWPGIQRKVQGRRILAEFIAETIARRRASGNLGSDLLGILLASVDTEGNGRSMSDEQAHAEAMTLFFAGHHTAAAALAWTLYLLATHPDAQDRLAAESRAPTPLPPAGNPRTGSHSFPARVLKESMRIYPPVWALFARQAVVDVELGGYDVPAGSWLFVYPWVLHHDERFFPDPWRFDPDRFLPERAEQIPVGAYIPFGLGGHACAGMRMAESMLQAVLPKIVARYSLAVSPQQGPIALEPLVSLRPRGDIRLALHRRSLPARVTEPSAAALAHV